MQDETKPSIRIALIGASGRMGRAIIQTIDANSYFQLVRAFEREGHPAMGGDAGVNAGIDPSGVKICNVDLLDSASADVLIDFSSPEGIVARASQATANGCGVVIGTTGLSPEQHKEFKDLAESGARIVVAPNMSIGVNVLFMLCRLAVRLLGKDYDKEIVEMHHRYKKDAPSGTALKLAEVIVSESDISEVSPGDPSVLYGRKGMIGERSSGEIAIHALRGGDVIGDHTAIFAGDGERIELVHKASNRTTFAKGSLRAAEFISNAKPGVYDMEDVLRL